MSEEKNCYHDLQVRLLEYIRDETQDSMYYQKLSGKAPDEQDKKLLLEFSRDEAEHAANFKRVYRRITGTEPVIETVSPPEISSYYEAVKARIMAESSDVVKYGEEFISTPDRELAGLFYITGAIENRHGMQLTTLLCSVE